ncbi:MAG: hypothetical protein H7196_00570 [candidate division SR1 bacterium]|nr:hypothetical protein [candidate division SR1 bacterium]
MANTKSSTNLTTQNVIKTITFVLILTLGLSFLYRIRPIGIMAQDTNTLSEKSPNYFYNRESAFILQHALDYDNGGMYLAVNKDGAKIDSIIPGEVWAYKANTLSGTDKTQVGQATCIRYFINEALRTKENGLDGINNLLPSDLKVNSSNELLKKAKICADFAISKMEIPQSITDKNLNQSPQDQADTFNPNTLFYWGVVSANGSKKFDDSNPVNTSETYRSESSLTWTFAELALAMKKADLPLDEYQPYVNAALRWWNWRTSNAVKIDEKYSPKLTSGAGRDLYYPALGFVLSEITGDNIYRDGDGTKNNDGSKKGAIPFANSQLGTGSVPNIPFEESTFALQEKTYTAALPRGTIFAKDAGINSPNNEVKSQWWDFGWDPLITQNSNNNYGIKSASSFTDNQLSQAFKHTGGRELLAGVLKSIWFYSTFGANPESFYVKETADKNVFSKANFSQATKEYWDVLNEKLWDDTAGQQAWLEAVNAPYKPCFSGDNDIPFGDWKKPIIGDKVHSVNPDNSSTVTISGVSDLSTPYLSINFAGSGIKKVEVVYTINKGQSWATIPTNFNGTNYTSTIPAVDPGTTVYYYAKAVDNFNNWTAFPTGSETWSDANVTENQDYTKAQTYTIPAIPGGFGGGDSVNTPQLTPVNSTDPNTTPISPSKIGVKPPFGFGGNDPVTSSPTSLGLIRTGGRDN